MWIIKTFKQSKILKLGLCLLAFMMGWWLWDVVFSAPPAPNPSSIKPVPKPAPKPYFYFEDEASRKA